LPDIDFTTALGRLLSDAALRREYFEDPMTVAQRICVNPSHLHAFINLDRDALDLQARALIEKRYYEASNFLPVTINRLGERATTLFFELAEEKWHTDHRRHLKDAVMFCEYLSRNYPTQLCTAEFNWLRFLLVGKRWAVHLVRQFPDGQRQRPALQLLFRSHSGASRQCVLFLAR
jgi:hypothetical protein